LLGMNSLRLEAAHAMRRPVIDLLADPRGRFHLVVPAGTGRAEIRARVVDARADLVAAVDPLARRDHHARIDFAGWEGRGDAVGEKEDGIDGRLVYPSLPEEIDGVVRVQVEHAREHILIVA